MGTSSGMLNAATIGMGIGDLANKSFNPQAVDASPYVAMLKNYVVNKERDEAYNKRTKERMFQETLKELMITDREYQKIRARMEEFNASELNKSNRQKASFEYKSALQNLSQTAENKAKQEKFLMELQKEAAKLGVNPLTDPRLLFNSPTNVAMGQPYYQAIKAEQKPTSQLYTEIANKANDIQSGKIKAVNPRREAEEIYYKALTEQYLKLPDGSPEKESLGLALKDLQTRIYGSGGAGIPPMAPTEDDPAEDLAKKFGGSVRK